LYEKFWGNGGWAKTDKGTERTHGADDCVRALKVRTAALEVVAEAAEAVCLWMDWDMESPSNPGKHPQIDRLVNAITALKNSAPMSQGRTETK
jgi:hypothetical protein